MRRRICWNCVHWERIAETDKGFCKASPPHPQGYWPETHGEKHWCDYFKSRRILGVFPVNQFKREHGYP